LLVLLVVLISPVALRKQRAAELAQIALSLPDFALPRLSIFE
jgi:hypothetical protein